jgi:hypothetical protein
MAGSGKLAMVRPIPMTLGSSSGGAVNAANLVTSDPKEAASYSAGTRPVFSFDFGSAQTFDTVFAGFLTPAVAIDFYFGNTLGGAEAGAQNAVTPQASPLVDPDYHAAYVLAAPVTCRYFRIQTNAVPTAAGTIGILAAGLSIQPNWGQEFGAGRPIEDTGTAERLFSGGFGVYEGARVGGYQWTFGDLSDAEVQSLYALAMDRGTTRPVLIIEDPTQSSGLNERIHWGLFDRLEAYERQVPGASRYAFKVRDWV